MAHRLRALTVVLGLLAGFVWPALSAHGSQPEVDGSSESQPEAPQPADSAPVEPAPTVERVRARIEELSESEDIDESVRASAVDLYEQAIAHLSARQAAAQRAAEFRRLTSEAPAEIEAIKQELGQPPAPISVEAPADATVKQVEQSRTQAEADLGAARSKVESLEAEVEQRRGRREEIPDQIAQRRQQLQEIEEDLEATGGADPGAAESSVVAEARGAMRRAQAAMLRTEIEALEAELASYDAREELLPLRRDRAVRRVQQAEQRVEAWRKIVNRAREAQAQRQRRETERLALEAARQHPVLKRFAEELEQLAAQRAGEDGFIHRISEAQQTVSRVEEQLGELRAQFDSAQRRIEASGLTRATGLLLRRHLQALPDPEELRRRVKAVQRELASADFRRIEFEEMRQQAGGIDATVASLMEQIRAEGGVEDLEKAEEVARDLASRRRDTLVQLADDAADLFDALFRLDAVRRDLLKATVAYESFIRERILWVRSIGGDGTGMSRGDLQWAIDWVASPTSWRRALDRSLQHALATLWVSLPVVAVPVLFLLTAGVCRRRINRLTELVSSFRTDSLTHTIWALALTILRALPLPAVLWVAGWLLDRPPEQEQIAVAIGASIQTAALFLFPAMLLLETLRPRGLAEAHFRWPIEAIRCVRFHLEWFLPIVVPMIVLTSAAEHPDEAAASAIIGRASFTVIMLALALFIQRLLRPSSPLLKALLGWQRSEWFTRTRIFWYPLLVLAPLALVAISWLGYHYTALVLAGRIEATIWLVFGLVLVNGLLMRWLFIARRRVAIENARRRREQAAASADGESVETVRTEASVAPVEESQLDLPAISAQSQQLFRTIIGVSTILGLYLIWANVLPALRALDRVEVWPNQRIVEASVSQAADILRAETPATTPAPAPAQPVSTGEAGASAPPAPSGNGASPSAMLGQPTLGAGGASTAGTDTGEASMPPPRVTLADLGLAIVVLIATVIAFKNIPGLAEIFILQRLPLDPSGRYAINTVMRYIIAIIGVLIAFNVIGLRWSSVQWLAAALTFGLAFGLQEIFANFVSGLIILAERPIRIGDTVTIGGVSGTVTRIRMRATTIVDWDRKELVIPNKTFITGDIINWSLSDTILRLTVPVGVSYGSDIDRVERELLEIAKAHKLVLDTPAPYVLFNRFGDSTLDFELRVFLTHLDHLLTVKHDLHNAITKAFRKAEIEIAFPQRDLHVRSIGPLGDALAQPTTKAEALAEPASARPGSAS